MDAHADYSAVVIAEMAEIFGWESFADFQPHHLCRYSVASVADSATAFEMTMNRSMDLHSGAATEWIKLVFAGDEVVMGESSGKNRRSR